MFFIGLMGVGNDGTLFTPSGNRLFRVPLQMAILIQRAQHWVAAKTWK